MASNNPEIKLTIDQPGESTNLIDENGEDFSNHFPGDTLLSTTQANVAKKPKAQSLITKTLLNCCRSPISSSFCNKRLKELKKYRNQVDSIYEAILKHLAWQEFPGGHHHQVVGINYLACKIWGISFAFFDMGDNLKKFATLLKLYEDLFVASEKLGSASMQIFEKLLNLSDDNNAALGTSRPLDSDLKTRFDKCYVLKGNKIQDFKDLRAALRVPSSSNWDKVRNCLKGDTILSSGVEEMTAQFAKMQLCLSDCVKVLKTGTDSYTCFGTNLRHTFKWMQNCQDFLQSQFPEEVVGAEKVENHNPQNDTVSGERDRIGQTLAEAESHIVFILHQGEMIVNGIAELVLVIRLSYIFMRNGLEVSFRLSDQEDLLRTRLKGERKYLLKWTEYDIEDFYKTSCPDCLRKVPVIVGQCNELGLFDENYQKAQHLIRKSLLLPPAARTPSSLELKNFEPKTANGSLEHESKQKKSNVPQKLIPPSFRLKVEQ